MRPLVIAALLSSLTSLSMACGEGSTSGVTSPIKRPSTDLAFAPQVDRGTGASLSLATDAIVTPVSSAVPTNLAPSKGNAIGVANATPLSSAPVGHLDGPDRLARFFEHLAKLDDGHGHDDVRILQYGDSHTASDMGVGAFRRHMQARFGDGGRGFVSLGRPWKSYVQEGVRGYMTDEFEPVRMRLKELNPAVDCCFGLLGVGIEASAPGSRAWTDMAPRFSRIEIDYWQEPHAGSFDVFIDGARAGRVTARAAQPAAGYASYDVSDAAHAIEVRTIGDGPVRVFGMTLDRAQAGVVVDALGINGAQIFTALRWNEEHFAEQVRHQAPDLVVLAYGTNEAVEPKLEDADYERGLVDILGRVARAVPNAGCMLLGPPDLARWTKGTRGYHTWPRVVEIAAIQKRVARAAGCGFYDQIEAMGGPGSMATWAEEADPRAQQDRMHLTRIGYAQVGTAFASDLQRAYDEWRAEMGLPPTGADKTWNVARR
ncbi:MAG TPA: GDSL-type esterase/lipase family protein [Polyangiaceae bacterium]|nr:GDSL-type esterase/lipase family protein [Polyangiaceae bacterium]